MTSVYKIEIKERNDDTVRFHLKSGTEYLTFAEVFNLWKKNSDFIATYVAALISLDYQAFYWEHPAIKKEFLQQKYECILQRSRPLEQLPINENAFKDYLSRKEQVVDFMNLGKDARLVVPTKKGDKEIHNHIGRFIRLASQEQISEVFKRVGKAIIEEVEKQKIIWLNTAGLGVIWLHIRMDARPKYYKTERYKNPDFLSPMN